MSKHRSARSTPTITLAAYARVMRRADRDQLKAEIRALLGVG